jgi:uroporphyrinogen-III synthase
VRLTTTLSRGSLPGLAAVLRGLGLGVRHRALLSFSPVEDWAPLDAALSNARRFAALAVCSPRAARAVRERLEALPRVVAQALPPVWAVGPATARELEGVVEMRIAAPGGARSLAHQMRASGVAGPVLYPCGENHRDELPLRLTAHGLPVHEVLCYVAVLASLEETAAALKDTELVLIGSHRVLAIAARARPDSERPGLVCLGPATASSARAQGWEPVAVAETPTVPGVRRAIRGLRSARFK